MVNPLSLECTLDSGCGGSYVTIWNCSDERICVSVPSHISASFHPVKFEKLAISVRWLVFSGKLFSTIFTSVALPGEKYPANQNAKIHAASWTQEGCRWDSAKLIPHIHCPFWRVGGRVNLKHLVGRVMAVVALYIKYFALQQSTSQQPPGFFPDCHSKILFKTLYFSDDLAVLSNFKYICASPQFWPKLRFD